MNAHATHACLAAASAEAARVARGVAPERLSAATPCTDFDVRALVNHWVLYTSHGLEHRARREALPAGLEQHDFTADPDWASAYAARLARAVAAWEDPAAWEGEIEAGGMELPAAEVAGMVLKEMVVHGWDVARATGQEFHCPEEAAEPVLGLVEKYAGIYRRYDGFAEPVAVDAGASAFERALALSGRDPRWTAPVTG